MYRGFNIATPHWLDQYKTSLWLLLIKEKHTAVFYTTRRQVWMDFRVKRSTRY